MFDQLTDSMQYIYSKMSLCFTADIQQFDFKFRILKINV